MSASFQIADGAEVCFVDDDAGEFTLDALCWRVDEVWRIEELAGTAKTMQDIADEFPTMTPQDWWHAFFGVVDGDGRLPPSCMSDRIWELLDTAPAMRQLIAEFPHATLYEWGRAFAAIGGDDDGPFPPAWDRRSLQ